MQVCLLKINDIILLPTSRLVFYYENLKVIIYLHARSLNSVYIENKMINIGNIENFCIKKYHLICQLIVSTFFKCYYLTVSKIIFATYFAECLSLIHGGDSIMFMGHSDWWKLLQDHIRFSHKVSCWTKITPLHLFK